MSKSTKKSVIQKREGFKEAGPVKLVEAVEIIEEDAPVEEIASKPVEREVPLSNVSPVSPVTAIHPKPRLISLEKYLMSSKVPFQNFKAIQEFVKPRKVATKKEWDNLISRY